MMCEGGSPASCRMYSPRSVSTAATPAAASASFTPASSESIDFDLIAFLTPCRLQTPSRSSQASSRLSAQRLEELRAELGHRLGAQRREPGGLELAQVRLQGRVRKRLRRAGLEMHRLDVHQFSPARTSAT